MIRPVKIAISGAAGHISYVSSFKLADKVKKIFGPDARLDLRLLDLEANLPALTGVAKELEDCAFDSLQDISITHNPKKAFIDANYAILIGSIPHPLGTLRSDLLEKNGKIFATQGDALNENAADDIRILTVANPCNLNTLIAMHHAPRIPRERFYALTGLSHMRGIVQLAKKANVDTTEIKNMIVWGNRSSTEFPDATQVTIKGKPVLDIIKDRDWLQNEFIHLIRTRGVEVMKVRPNTSESAAHAIINSLYNLTHDTAPGDCYSIGICSQGQYGIDEGMIFSFPCRTSQGKVSIVDGIELDDFQKSQLKATLEEIRSDYKAAKDLKFID